MPTPLLVDLAPGVALVGLAAGLRGLLVRWFDPLPWRVLGTFVALVVLEFPAALLGGRALLPLHLLTASPPFEALAPRQPPTDWVQGDLVREVAPHEVVARRLLSAGEWPLWNPWVGAGMPILADEQAHAHWLEPITLPALALPLPEAFALVAGLRILVALVFTYLLLRRLRLGEGPAFFGAVAFGFGAFLQTWLLWPIANSAAVLPLALYAVVLAAERGARRDWALLVLAACAVLLAGHPETAFYVVLVTLAAAAGCVARTEAGRRRRLLARYGAAALLAGCFAAPALLPAMEYLPQTHRYHLLERRNQRLRSSNPLRDWRTPREAKKSLVALASRLAPTVAPLALGTELYGDFWGDQTSYLYGVAFPGTIALALALAAYSRRRERFPLERGMLRIGVPLTVLILARPPGLRQLFAITPLLDRSPADHARVALLLGFFLAVLGAMTLERWRTAKRLARAPLAITAALALVVPWIYVAFRPGDPTLLAGPRWRTGAIQLLLLALAASLLGLGRRPRARRMVPAVLGLVTFAELAMLLAPANSSLPKALYYPQTPATRFLDRELSSAGEAGYRFVGLGGLLPPNVPSVYGLSDPRISNASKPWSYTLLVAPLARSIRDMTDVFETADHPLYRLLGVRYLAIRDRFDLRSLRQVYRGDGLRIYLARKTPLGRLFLPQAARAGAGDWRRWTATHQDFGRSSLVSSLPDGQRLWRSHQPGGSPVALEATGSASRLRARVRLSEPRLLASSIYQDGNWHVLVNGRRVATVETNGIFVGAWLPAGETRLDVVYRPESFVAGLLLAALALAAALAWWLPPPRVGGPVPASLVEEGRELGARHLAAGGSR